MDTKEILIKARQEGYAVGAFNAGNLELAQAVVRAAQNQQKPVIIETSAKEAEHFGMENFLAVVENFRGQSEVQILTNLDHGPDLETAQRAIELGYDMVHFDGSKLPLEENISITRALVEMAHAKGVVVEAEMDAIVGSSEAHLQGTRQINNNYTDPLQAVDFVSKTGCDLLAVSVGNRHGTYVEGERINLELLKMLAQKVSCLFSLHGGSGIDQGDIGEAIRLGVVKININTELRIAYRETLENVLRGSDEVAIHQLMPPVIAAVQKVVEEKIELFNQGVNETSKEIPYIKPLS